MPVEIEAKMKLDDAEALVKRLQETGATRAGQVIETNSFYDTEDRILLAADKTLRIRSAQNVDSGEIRVTLTYKGPAQPGRFKSRDEIETTLSDADTLDRLFDRLGFVRIFRFQKHRQSWKLADCKVEIDRIPHLGTFVEIEGPSEESITRVRQMLHLTDRPILRGSYAGMLVSYLQERGESASDVRL